MASEARRRNLLRSLVVLEDDFETRHRELLEMPWDYEVELVIVAEQDVLTVLSRFVGGEIDASTVERWADALEVRDDVGFATSRTKTAIHALANPLLEGSITSTSASDMASRLR